MEKRAQDVVSLFREAGFRVNRVADMDGWLQRHAVFITAMAGALYEMDCDARRLARNPQAVRGFILAVREGWAEQDRKCIPSSPTALRAIMCWVPLGFSTMYWCRLLDSPRGDLYYARHARHAPAEMAALAADVRGWLCQLEAPELRRLLATIDVWRCGENRVARDLASFTEIAH